MKRVALPFVPKGTTSSVQFQLKKLPKAPLPRSGDAGLGDGVRVRHAQFGVGTVLNVEQLEDDSKLLVRFVSVGQKTLRAKYAKLELVG